MVTFITKTEVLGRGRLICGRWGAVEAKQAVSQAIWSLSFAAAPLSGFIPYIDGVQRLVSRLGCRIVLASHVPTNLLLLGVEKLSPFYRDLVIAAVSLGQCNRHLDTFADVPREACFRASGSARALRRNRSIDDRKAPAAAINDDIVRKRAEVAASRWSVLPFGIDVLVRHA